MLIHPTHYADYAMLDVAVFLLLYTSPKSILEIHFRHISEKSETGRANLLSDSFGRLLHGRGRRRHGVRDVQGVLLRDRRARRPAHLRDRAAGAGAQEGAGRAPPAPVHRPRRAGHRGRAGAPVVAHVPEGGPRPTSCIAQVVDKFNEWLVSAFLTASRVRFVILHTQKNEEGIRQFFQEMYEVYIKHCMNPFYVHDQPIKSAAFEQKVVFYARKFLNV